MQSSKLIKTRRLRVLRLGALGALLVSLVAAAEDTSRTGENALPVPEFAPALRWGRPVPESRSVELSTALETLFKRRANDLNFSKRGLSNLLEEALPRQLGRLFPFRRVHAIPENFFFENLAPVAFLVGEFNTRVPPILAETSTAEWLDLKSREPLSLARELTPQAPVQQGLRALGLQSPLSTEIFSSGWTKHFETASAILEHGGINCLRKSLKKNEPAGTGAPMPAHFRCSTPLNALAKDNGITKQLPRKLGALPAHPTPAPQQKAVQPTCVPMGRMGMQVLELLGDEKAGHCLLWRASKDERFQQKAFHSKLICLNARHKSFLKTRFNAVVALVPSSRADTLHIVESDDGLVTSHSLSLPTLTFSKDEVTTNSGQNLRNTVFPQQRTGLYACQTPAQSSLPQAPFPPEEVIGANMEWIYLDDSLYAGIRPVRPEADFAWRIKETGDSSIDVERLSWSQLQYDHPSITSERPFVCAASRSVDAKCATRILQTALQISEEWRAGEFERSEHPVHAQLSVLLLVAQALEKTMTSLPDWALQEETRALLEFFDKKARTLSENQLFAGMPPRIDRSLKAFPKSRIYLDLPRDSQDYLAIKNAISSAADSWALLKQKPL